MNDSKKPSPSTFILVFILSIGIVTIAAVAPAQAPIDRYTAPSYFFASHILYFLVACFKLSNTENSMISNGSVRSKNGQYALYNPEIPREVRMLDMAPLAEHQALDFVLFAPILDRSRGSGDPAACFLCLIVSIGTSIHDVTVLANRQDKAGSAHCEDKKAFGAASNPSICLLMKCLLCCTTQLIRDVVFMSEI